jgi:hypothetical protein
MSDQQASNETPGIQFEHGVPIINARLSEVERKQAEAERRDQQYKTEQIALNARLVKATRALVLTSIAIGSVGAIQLFYTHRQWKLTSEGLSKMGDQIWAAKDAAYAARKAADTVSQARADSQNSFVQTLGQIKSQTAAQQRSAKAAVGSIEVTKASLRAAITISPKPDWPHKLVGLDVNNTGKITSGPIELILHSATVRVPTPFGVVDLKNAIDHHWKRHYFPSSAIGVQYSIAVPFASASEAELTAGTQALLISGYVTYNDGFLEDAKQTETFCTHTMVQTVAKELFLSPCDGKEIIPKMEHLDGYPNNEDQY